MCSTHWFADVAVFTFEMVFDWKLPPTRLRTEANFYVRLLMSKIYFYQAIGPGLFPTLIIRKNYPGLL